MRGFGGSSERPPGDESVEELAGAWPIVGVEVVEVVHGFVVEAGEVDGQVLLSGVVFGFEE